MDEIESKIIRVYPEHFRKLNHEIEGVNGHIKNLPRRNINTVLQCPYLKENDVVELLGFWNNKVVGAIEYCFPLKISIAGDEYFVSSGSTLYVDEEYRKESGMGAFLMMEKTKIHPSKNNLSSGVSQMAFPLYKKLKYVAFETPRMMHVNHSYSVIEHYLPLGSLVVHCLSSVIDAMLKCYSHIVYKVANLNTYECRKIKTVTDSILRIIESDKHACKEVHDKDWWDWILNNSISEGDVQKELYEILYNGKVVGFFLNKIEFHESASSRGFKKVTLGSVLEWGFDENSSLDEYKTQLLAIKNMPKDVDAVEVISVDDKVVSKFKKSMMMQVGCANMLIRLKGVAKGSWEDKSLWRIRLAAADVALN